MAKISNVREFVPELWSEQIIKEFKFHIHRNHITMKRSKGERLLRAAAQGASQEELDKIDNDEPTATVGELYDFLKEEWANDAADALRYAIDADIMGNLSTGARTK